MDLKQAILKTICYFDLFDYPLSLKEITDYLWRFDVKEDVIRKTIRKMIGKEISRKGEFYFLKERDGIVKIRRLRLIISEKKLKKAKRILSLLRLVPFVRGIALTQNIAIKNCKEKSDADILIITSRNRVWISRVIVNLILDIFRKRNPKNNNRICPNFFLSLNNLNIQNIALDKEDIYLAYWVKTIKPLFGSFYFNEFNVNNIWATNLVPNKKQNFKNEFLPNPLLRFIQKIIEFIIMPFSSKLNKYLKDKQIKVINKNKRNAKNPSIITEEDIVKIHYEDKRDYYKKEWIKKIEKRVEISA